MEKGKKMPMAVVEMWMDLNHRHDYLTTSRVKSGSMSLVLQVVLGMLTRLKPLYSKVGV